MPPLRLGEPDGLASGFPNRDLTGEPDARAGMFPNQLHPRKQPLSRKSKSQKKRRAARAVAQTPTIDSAERATLALTVGWMLTVFCTAVAEVLGGAAFLLEKVWPLTGDDALALAAVPNVMLFIATITGLLSLALTPFVYRVQRSRLPPLITTLAMAIGLIPLVTITVLLVRR